MKRDSWLDYSRAGSTGNTNWMHGKQSFATSYDWNKKYQTVPVPAGLGEALADTDSDTTITATEKYSRVYCGDEYTGIYRNHPTVDRYYLTLRALDSAGYTLHEKSTGIIHITEPCEWSIDWKDAKVEIMASELGPDAANVASIQVEHGGISGEWWKGHYGPAMKDISGLEQIRVTHQHFPTTVFLFFEPHQILSLLIGADHSDSI